MFSERDVSRPSLQKIYGKESDECDRCFREVWTQLIEERRRALARDERNPEIYLHLAGHHAALMEDETALSVLREGLTRCRFSVKLHYAYIEKLRKLNRTQDAIDAIHQALRVFPHDLAIRMKESLILPVIYQTVEEIGYYRRRFWDGLSALAARISLETPESRRDALNAVSAHRNVLLGYQGENDLELQQRYGNLVHRIVAANFPEWADTPPMPGLNGKLRIGYVSSYFLNHSSVVKTFLRWLLMHDRVRFDVHAYQVGQAPDCIADELRRSGMRFAHFSDSVHEVARAVRADRLHVLVFLDIGRSPVMTLLAALRLAPIQCMAWDHPITSGLPTMNYYLSSALMEPPNGQDHYSEKLICLPGVGVCYQKPVIPRALLGKRRPDYGLRDNAILYLSCQSTFKYLPQHDDLFPAIALRLPSAQFVFLTPNHDILKAFRTRLGRAFSVMGLSVDDFCVFLPQQDIFNYWNLNLLSDVFLDTIEWSGGVTTVEAIACGLPIVTLPGRLMRGRHSYAILTQFGVTDTIARDKPDYVNIAVRLGLDHAWRQNVVERFKQGSRVFYSDTCSLSTLEDFYQEAVKQHSSSLSNDHVY